MLKYLLVAFVLLRSATRATPTGNHTCTGVVKHEVTVRVNVTEPVTYRAYEWCLRVPPRCSTYTIQQKDRIKIHKEMHNRTITVCCKGYVEIDYKCVPACPPNMDCQNMHCNRTNHCYCTPGYTGLYCNDPCPKGVWGAGCIKECDCPSGYTCHHLTGDCMIDDSPPPKTRRTTTTTTTLAAETSTNFITSTSTKIPSSSTVITERPTPRITLPTSTSVATERLTTENVQIISTVPTTTTPVPSTQTYAPVKTEPTTLAALPTTAIVITTKSTETMTSTTMPPTVTTTTTTTPTTTTPTTTTPTTTTPTTTTPTTMPSTLTTPTTISSTITSTTLPTPSTEMLTTQPPPTSPITTTLPPTTITTQPPPVTTITTPTLKTTVTSQGPSTTQPPTTMTLPATTPTLPTVTQQTTEAVVWPKMNSTLAQEPTTITTVPIELTIYDTSTPSRLPSTVSTTLSTVPYFDLITTQTVQSSTVPAVTEWKPINPTMPDTRAIEDAVITSSQPINVPYLTDLLNISQAPTLTSERTTYTFSTAPQHLETSTKNVYSTFGVSIDKAPTPVEEITTVITVTEKPITVPTAPPTVFETTMTTIGQTTSTKAITVPSTTETNSESPFKNDNDIEVQKNDTKDARSENYAQPTLTTSSAQDQLVVEDVEPRQFDFDSDPIKIVQEAIDKYFPETLQNNVVTTSTPSTIPSTTTVAPPRVIVSPVNPDEIDLGGIIYRKMKLYPAEMATTVDSSDDRFKLYLPNYDDKSSETTIKTTIKEEDDKTHLIKKAKPKEKEVKKYKVKYESTLTTPVQNEDGPLTTNNVLLETKEFKVHLASTKPHKTKENFDQFRHNLNEVKHNVVHETTKQIETTTLENDVVHTESPLKPHTWYSHVKEKERIKNALKVVKSTTIVDRQFKPTESSQLDDESNDIHSVVTEYNSEREARSAQEEDSYEQELTGPQSFEKVKFQARQSYSSSVVSDGGNDKIYFVVFSSIGVVSSVAAAAFVVVLGLKLRAKRRTFVDERETRDSRQTVDSLSNYETIYPQTDSTNAEMTTFFCPTFTNNYAERINREYREMSYDHPRRPSCAEPLYEEICRCSSNKY